jgi:hypothetical protein
MLSIFFSAYNLKNYTTYIEYKLSCWDWTKLCFGCKNESNILNAFFLLENTQCGILKKEIVVFFIVMTEMFAFVRDMYLFVGKKSLSQLPLSKGIY